METGSEQYYPTYHSKNRDVLLIEFEEAQKIANGQSKVYGQVTNVLLAIATFSFTFFLNQDSQKADDAVSLFSSNALLFSLILFVIGGILLRYFVDLQKQITINARKVVTLRTLLGLDYGNIHLTLPNWRVEGATNPFAVKYFNGWLNFKTMPFWLVTITVNAIWWISTKNLAPLVFELKNFQFQVPLFYGIGLISLAYFLIFRKNLNDRHETVYLNLVKAFSWVLRIKLIENFEYIIYRAKLSYLELDRLKVDYKNLIEILVDVEDQSFYQNSGVSIKSLVRGSLSRFKFFRNKFGFIQHGGSTIIMQLTRSLFIPSNQNKYLRKLIEILLSIWLNGQFSKNELLKLYVASVRFEKGVLGLSNALKFFFNRNVNTSLANEEAFFLVERLSNISSTVNQQRIQHLISRTSVTLDKAVVARIYSEQIKKGRLKNN